MTGARRAMYARTRMHLCFVTLAALLLAAHLLLAMNRQSARE